MENGITHITTETATYPLVFNINVIEVIQEKYGSLDKWSDIIEGNIRNEKGEITGKELPPMKDIKFFIKEAVNEGIDIENEEKGEERPFITDKQAGRILSLKGQDNVLNTIKGLTVSSIKTDKQIEEEKNV